MSAESVSQPASVISKGQVGLVLNASQPKLKSLLVQCSQAGPKTVKFFSDKEENLKLDDLFIEDNQSGSEPTKGSEDRSLRFNGGPVETTDMKGLKKIEDH